MSEANIRPGERHGSPHGRPASPRRGAVRLGAVVRLAVVGILGGLALVYLASGIRSTLLVAGPALTNTIGKQIGTDFTVFYTAARLTADGRVAAVYDPEALRAAHAELAGGPVGLYRWTYPPPALFLFAPLAAFPPVAALWAWLAATTAWLAIAVVLAVGWRPAALVVPIFPAVVHAILTGPTGTLTAALLATLAASLGRSTVVSALCVAALAYKPHLAALVPLCLAAGGHWRPLVAAAAVAAGLVAASLAIFGLEPWAFFVTNVPHHLALVAEARMSWLRMPTVFVAVRHATGDAALASWLQSLTTAAAVGSCALVWRRTVAPAPRWLALAAGLVLASPYALDYDEAGLVVPFAWLAATFVQAGRGPTGILVLLWVTPVAFAVLSEAVGQQCGPVPLLVLLVWAVRESLRAPQGATAGSHK